MSSDARLVRLLRNEEMFREVNERMADVAEPFEEVAASGQPIGFVCECSRAECVEHVAVSLDTYRSVRDDPDQFLLLPGHENAEIEDVIHEQPAYLVVRKRI